MTTVEKKISKIIRKTTELNHVFVHWKNFVTETKIVSIKCTATIWLFGAKHFPYNEKKRWTAFFQ